MAIQLNQGQFGGLAALASNNIGNLNLPLNDKSPLGSLFSGLQAGYNKGVENDLARAQAAVAQQNADVNTGRLALDQQLEPQKVALMKQEMELNNKRLLFDKYKLDLEAAKNLSDQQLDQMGSLGGGYITMYQMAKTPQEKEAAKNKNIDIGVQIGVLNEKEADAARNMDVDTYFQKAQYYHNLAKDAKDLKQYQQKEPSAGVDVQFDSETGNLKSITSTPTSTTTSQVQSDLVNAQKDWQPIAEMEQKFNSEYFTDLGQIGISAVAQAERKKGIPVVGKALQFAADKLTGKSREEQKQFVVDATKYINNMEQFFNRYRKQITGSAAAIQEIQMLRKSYVNKELSESQFIGALQGIKERYLYETDFYKNVLTKGVDVTPGTQPNTNTSATTAAATPAGTNPPPTSFEKAKVTQAQIDATVAALKKKNKGMTDEQATKIVNGYIK